MASDRQRDELIEAAAVVFSDGEEVIDLTVGMVRVRCKGYDAVRKGTVFVTDRRVVLFMQKVRGYDAHDFAYDRLSSVDHQQGVMFGELDLTADGDRARIYQVPKDEVGSIAETIREYMAAARSDGPAVAAAPAPADVSTAIRKLAELRDDGLLTEEEFQAKKRLLLGL